MPSGEGVGVGLGDGLGLTLRLGAGLNGAELLVETITGGTVVTISVGVTTTVRTG
jgi:hypothetical protein